MIINKKTFYVFCFTLLGILIGFLFHAGLELWAIKLIMKDLKTYENLLFLTQLSSYHPFWAAFLSLVFGGFGFWSGEYWWQQIYVPKRYRK